MDEPTVGGLTGAQHLRLREIEEENRVKVFYCDDYDDDSGAVNAAIAWAAEHDESTFVYVHGLPNPESERDE